MSEFIWLDLETTGLDPDRDIILEFAAGIADDGPGGSFTPIEIVQSVVTPYDYAGRGAAQILDEMDPYVLGMHTRNGLLAELERPELCCTIEELDEHMASFLTEMGKPSLAGNSVHFDLGFVKKHMPKFAARLSHRVFDVSTLLRAERTYGDSHGALYVPASAHRAREDVLASLETAGRFVARRFR